MSPASRYLYGVDRLNAEGQPGGVKTSEKTGIKLGIMRLGLLRYRSSWLVPGHSTK